MRGFILTVPLFLPGLAVSFALALVFTPILSQRLHARPAVAFLLLASVGSIVAATLTPIIGALDDGIVSSGACNMRRLGYAPLTTYSRISEPTLNVLLFVPLGIALGLLPRTRAAAVLTVGGLLMPLFVEAMQMLVPWLGRGCETADIVDNTTGLIIGLVGARAVSLVVGRRRT